jgi:hypothetical protein
VVGLVINLIFCMVGTVGNFFPFSYFVEALEEIDMILVTNEQLQELDRTIPAIGAMLDSLNRGANIANNKRMHAAISFTAEERFSVFRQRR